MNVKTVVVRIILLVAIVVMVTFSVNKAIQERERHIQMWGPNPGTVEYETSLGTKGTIVIRDKGHAEEEVRAKIKEIWDSLKKNPDFKVEGNTEDYTFTKFTVK